MELILFVSHESKRGLLVQTIEKRLSAIKSIITAARGPVDWDDFLTVKSIISNKRLQGGTKPDRRLPITCQHLLVYFQHTTHGP